MSVLSVSAAVYAEGVRLFPNLSLPEPELYRLILALERLGHESAALAAIRVYHLLYPGAGRLGLLLLRAARLGTARAGGRAPGAGGGGRRRSAAHADFSGCRR